MKLGIKQMLPFDKNKEILARLIKSNPDSIPDIINTLRTLRWEGPKREDLSRLIAFAQEVERTGTETNPVDREIDRIRREFIDQRKKPQV